MNNLEKYKKDLDQLIDDANSLYNAMCNESLPDQVKKQLGKKYDEFVKDLPNFKTSYQIWYSESLSIIKLLLPYRVDDFVKLYEKPKARKSISYENYVIADYLQDLTLTRGWEKEKVVGPDAAIPQLTQQIGILKSCKKRFESSLFDIKQLIQADLFVSELDAAKELNNKGFIRGAGAIAGVVLEHHLSQVCQNHKLQIGKKNPTISDYNDLLKSSQVIELPKFRSIQYLGDLRNLCDHKKSKEPSKEEIDKLIEGVNEVTKTVF